MEQPKSSAATVAQSPVSVILPIGDGLGDGHGGDDVPGGGNGPGGGVGRDGDVVAFSTCSRLDHATSVVSMMFAESIPTRVTSKPGKYTHNVETFSVHPNGNVGVNVAVTRVVGGTISIRIASSW